MPVDFVDRLEEQLREAAAVPPAVRRRRRLVAAARPAAVAAASVALAAGAVGAVAVASGDDASDGMAAGVSAPPLTERPPVPRPEPRPLPPVPASPVEPGPPPAPENLRTVPVPGAPTVPQAGAAPPPAPRPAVPAPRQPAPPPTDAVPAPAPAPGPTPAAPAPVPAVPARAPSVAVLNGTTSRGLAGRVAGVVAALGYRGLPSGNAPVTDARRTTLYATAGNVTAARALAATLGVPQDAVTRMTRRVAAVSPRASVAVVLGRTPAPPREVTSLRLTGPAGATGVASFVRRGDGTVALSLRHVVLRAGGRLTAWIPAGSGWRRLGELPASTSTAHVAVLAPAGRSLPEGFLLTAEPRGTTPASPGRTVLTSRG